MELFKTVIEGGYCVGCGACAQGISNGPIAIRMDEFGRYVASLNEANSNFSHDPALFCPFSAQSVDESTLARERFTDPAIKEDEHIGLFLSCSTGYAIEGNYRDLGSSGGMATWIACELLRAGEVDAIIHVLPHEGDQNAIFSFGISKSIENVVQGAKSRYYPVEMSKVLEFVRDNPGRYALLGLPCFVKAIRLLQRQHEVFASRIRFCLGIFCGHLKSRAYAEMIGAQQNLWGDELESIDFRYKVEGHSANDIGIDVRGHKDGKPVRVVSLARNLYGTNWGYGFFKYKACDYCDDVVAETADVSLGDAWIPECISDPKGTSILVVRNPIITQLLDRGVREGRISLTSVTAQKVFESQLAGFRHRRLGLSYRLALAEKEQRWAPEKRVKPSLTVMDRRYRLIQRLRVKLVDVSHWAWLDAKKKRDFEAFKNAMAPTMKEYTEAYRKSITRWFYHKLPKSFQRAIQNLIGLR